MSNYNFDQLQFQDSLKSSNSTVLFRTISTDMITPIQAAIKIFDQYPDYHFLLESAQNNDIGKSAKSRFCVIGVDPDKIWKCQDQDSFIADNGLNFKKQAAGNPLENFRQFFKSAQIDYSDLYYKAGQLPAISSGVFGYFGYDIINHIEKMPGKNQLDDTNIPDGIYIRPQILIIFDNFYDIALICAPKYQDSDADYDILSNKIEKIAEILESATAHKVKNNLVGYQEFSSNFTKEQYCDAVLKCQEYIKAGDIFQALPSQRFTANFNKDLEEFEFYRSLRSLNPSPFLFYLKLQDFVLAGSSPEIMVSLKDKAVTIRPLAGTRKRGKNIEEDQAIAQELLSDEKEVAEHLMLIDLGRHDVGKVCKANTVETTEKMKIEYYSHVMHISSNVQGKIREDLDALDALKSGFPAGTVSGAPKIRAMEIIQEIENTKRSFYAGCVGYFSGNGDMETCITLRSALIKDGKIYLQAGAGVVYDSNPESEYQECYNKAQALMKAYQQMKKD